MRALVSRRSFLATFVMALGIGPSFSWTHGFSPGFIDDQGDTSFIDDQGDTVFRDDQGTIG